MIHIPLSDFRFNTSVLLVTQTYRCLNHLKALSSKNKTKYFPFKYLNILNLGAW